MTDPESVPQKPQPRFLDDDEPLRLEDCFCVLRKHVDVNPDEASAPE